MGVISPMVPQNLSQGKKELWKRALLKSMAPASLGSSQICT